MGFLSGAHAIKGVVEQTASAPEVEGTKETKVTKSAAKNENSTNDADHQKKADAAQRDKKTKDRKDLAQKQESGGERPRRIKQVP